MNAESISAPTFSALFTYLDLSGQNIHYNAAVYSALLYCAVMYCIVMYCRASGADTGGGSLGAEEPPLWKNILQAKQGRI